MAKLGAYYGLCPIIDHRSLLGISEDEENGVVVVTLGKNIAIKYKLSDQKQLHSWRTKDKFTSPIIFDKESSKYVAVFNQTYIRTWSGNEEFLDKLKKFKFSKKIDTVFVCQGKSFILFTNGAVEALNEAVQNRKTLQPENVIDSNSEYVIEVLSAALNSEIYVGLVVKSSDCDFLYWTKFNESGHQTDFTKVALTRIGLDLTGYVFYVNKGAVNFLSLWNDGRVYSLELKPLDLAATNPGELFTVIESISSKDLVAMKTLDENYIALFGCNSNEEGALLIIFNVQFKVIQSKQPFKLFSKGAKLWSIESNLFLPVGQNLAVVPFHLDTEQLAALVGSHKTVESDPDVTIVQKVHLANWGQKNEKQKRIPKTLRGRVEEFVGQGLPENAIFEVMLPEIADKKDVEALSECLIYFSDIPEKCLSMVLKSILNFDAKVFVKSKLTLMTGSGEDYALIPAQVAPSARAQLLDSVFSKAFTEILILPHLRTDLVIEDVLILLQYICFLLSENGHALPNLTFVETSGKLIQWGCVLLDSNYQKLLLTRDDRISEVLLQFSTLVKEELSCLEGLRAVAPLVDEVKRGKQIHKAVHLANQSYTVEELSLF